jgi:hypothetical protein
MNLDLAYLFFFANFGIPTSIVSAGSEAALDGDPFGRIT